jgi:hypothetical protein
MVLSGYSFTTKTGCHDIAEILLKVALITKKEAGGHHSLSPIKLNIKINEEKL